MQIIILFLTFISIFSVESYSLLGIELEVNGKTFQIKNDEDEVKSYIYKTMSLGRIPQKYLDSMREILVDNQFKCKKKIFYSGGLYDAFYCPKKNEDFSSIKLSFKLNNTTVTLKEKQLFETRKDGNNYIKFRAQKETKILFIPTKLLDDQ